MSRIDDWLLPNRLPIPTAATRAASVWAWIQRKPTSITVVRDGAAIAAQTVRLELSGPGEQQQDTGVSARRTINVFGVQGHASVTDTSLRRGDNFQANGSTALNCEIISVDTTQIGQIQAIAEIME